MPEPQTVSEYLPGASAYSDPFLRDAAVGFLSARPDLSEAALRRALEDGWGLEGTLHDLGGERDSNNLVVTPQGARRVLKVFSAAETAEVRALQHDAMMRLGAAGRIATPRLHRTLAGGAEHAIGTHHAVLIDMMPGVPPRPDGSAAQWRMIGEGIASLHAALDGPPLAGARRRLLWDQMNALRLRELVVYIPDAALRARVLQAMDHLAERLPELAALPSGLIHNDLSPSNMLVDANDPCRLSGIFDFGDIVEAPRINDLAIAAAYFLDPAAPAAPQLAALLRGYAQSRPLEDREVAALPDAMLCRLLLRLIIPLWRSALFPANRAYLLRHYDTALALAEVLLPAGRLRFDRSLL